MREETASQQEQLVYLLPEEIHISETLNVRPFSSKMGESEAEIEAIEKLAATIAEEGQDSPVLVRKVIDHGQDTGNYELIFGKRRLQAISFINAERPKGTPPRKVKVLITEMSDARAFRHAMIENLHRKGFSPIDLAIDIAHIRDQFGWTGTKGTKKVAEFLKVSPAQVSQHEKLSALPEDIQEKIHKGELTADEGFKLADIADEQGSERAEKVIQEAKQAEQEATQEVITSAPGKKKRAGKKKAVAARARVIREAHREAKPQAHKHRTLKDVKEWMESMDGPAYGWPSGAARIFIRYFLDKWLIGEGTDKTLDKYWDAMTGRAPKGKPEKES